VRRGADVLKALALGARSVLLGRALLYGLGAGGDAGVARALAILRGELELALALAGARRSSAWIAASGGLAVDRQQERAPGHRPQHDRHEAAGVEADDEEHERQGEQEQRAHGGS
jgi:hypothetical protein